MAADAHKDLHRAAPSLALALIASSTAPLLLLDGDLTVIAASASFCLAFRIDPRSVAGRPIFDLGGGAWNLPRLRVLLQTTARGGAEVDAYEADIEQAAEVRRVVLNVKRIDYVDADRVRLLMAVSDVTEARHDEKLREDLVREKADKLKEVQTRIANSLQVLASVILQNAPDVRSDERRGHLDDAHHRVMSAAAVQRQLSISSAEEVDLRPYFALLCDSIGASMIRNHDLLSIKTTIDDGAVSPETSVSLGLIVTELVINALKHAYPEHRKGTIRVGYSAQGSDWTLSVRDDGVGMPTGRGGAVAGLGTSIVTALADQLKAKVQVIGLHPGTQVSIVHAQAAVRVDAAA